MKTIRDWPEGERPREKLLQRGPQALSDAELLAIFLRTGIPGKTAVDLARELLARFGSLRALLQADAKTFTACKGLGSAKYVQLQAALEMARRHLYESLQRGEALTSPQVTRAFLLRQLRDQPYEVFAALFLDTRHRLIAYEPLFRGTIDGASVHPREVARRALELNAAAVIFAHNHPSGDPSPSGADRQITARLVQALGLFDIRVLDHVVVGDGETFSFAEHGWL
ncbi:DNA repair protein RadC [Methylomarinovum caldicuralii]|uniref:DNA repair protein RadC n=1 Tax=Methylomarinovum caldicuralii TaxID=438856 RepID=A0AAU9BVB3_9GAMM|nr:DNA repair protein RadC [Methylomarinovum caldicuralii]BCX82676.1 DNA repair protein RadC [Methylomarinovum caldicuralii]